MVIVDFSADFRDEVYIQKSNVDVCNPDNCDFTVSREPQPRALLLLRHAQLYQIVSYLLVALIGIQNKRRV